MRTSRHHFFVATAMAVALGIALPLAQTRAGGAATAPPPAAVQRAAAPAAGAVTSPKQEWGHDVGADYFLANYQQVIAYWQKLEKDSSRVHIQEIGKTAEKRTASSDEMTAVTMRPDIPLTSTVPGPTIEQLVDVERARRDIEDATETMVPCPACQHCAGCGDLRLVTLDRANFLRALEDR